MLFNILNEELFFNLNLLIKLIILIIIIIKCICLANLSCPYKYGKYNKMDFFTIPSVKDTVLFVSQPQNSGRR